LLPFPSSSLISSDTYGIPNGLGVTTGRKAAAMRGKITKRSVDALTPNAGAEAVLWDGELMGFGVRVQRGGTKSYVLTLPRWYRARRHIAQADDRPAR
jgi:hypothetical protein